MARMSSNDERSSENYGDSLQLTYWILDSGATCHMTPEVSDFVPGSLEDTDKYIEVADVHHVTSKQKGQVRIKICDDNGKPFIATLHNVLLAPDLCDRLFSIIALINSVHTCLFHKGFCTVEEKFSNITTQCTNETCISRKNHRKVKEKQITSKKENCFRFTTSNISTQIHQIIVSLGYCKCLGRCRAKNISRSFFHIMSNFFNEQKG